MGDIAPISTIDVPATTKPWVTGDITARRYIEVWSDTILELVFKTIAPVAPHPHPRLRWTVPNDVPSRLQTWAKLELERFGGSAEESVRRILFPLDLLALVDTYRNTQPPPSGQERGDLVGSGAWETTLGEALAAEARPSVLASIRRMGER